MSVKTWFGCKCAGGALSIKLKVEIRSEDLRPIVAFPVANLHKITSLKQPPLESGVQLPLEAGHCSAPSIWAVQVPSALL